MTSETNTRPTAPRLSTARRVTVLALLLVALYRLHLVFITMGLEQIITGFTQGDGITIAIAITLLFNLLAIPLVLYVRTWGLLIGFLVLVINIVFSGPFLLKALADPQRLGSWTWSLLILSGNVLGLVFGMIAIVEGFVGPLPPWAEVVQGRILKGAAAATGGMLLLGVALSFASAPATTGLSAAPDAVVEVALEEMRFHPEQIELAKDQRTALFLINRDDFQHAFDVDALDIHVTIPAQSSTVVFVQPTESDQLHFYCGVPGHEAAGMEGMLTVR